MFRPNVFIMRWVCIAIFLTSMHIVNYSASAATVPGDAKQYMDKLATKTLGILGNKDIPLTEREQKVRTLLGENLAIEAIGRFVVGRAWRGASDEQKSVYRDLFESFITITYAKRLGGYAGERFTITSSKSVGKKGDALVTTEIQRPSGPPLKASWRIRYSKGAFLILDVMVEGISMVVAQRAEFTTIIKKSGMQGLIETLRAKASSFGVRAPK